MPQIKRISILEEILSSLDWRPNAIPSLESMFEFHGWISINADDSDNPDNTILEHRENELSSQIEAWIHHLQRTNRAFHLHRDLNGSSHLVFCGFHNHRAEAIIEFFKKVAEHQPWSYGKLHVRDDEKGDFMQQWTMARGRTIEETDERMSPCIPVIEPEI